MTNTFENPRDPGALSTAPVLVIGAGPAGLTAALELTRLSPGLCPMVVEAGTRVGGIARTEQYKGYRFDIGGHRFFTKVPEVESLWKDILGDELIEVPRSSRIFYRDQFYDYPLRIGNALSNLGLFESLMVGMSYLRWRLFPSRQEDNFEQWVTNRFGARLYRHFFRTYTEKVWGVPPQEIRADWAAQRIKDLSLVKAVVDSVTGRGESSSLIKTFRYPRLGPGQMWERAADLVEEAGGEVRLDTRVTALHREGSRVLSATVEDGTGRQTEARAEQFLSTMPITQLVRQISPAPPDSVLEAAAGLRYRDFLIVILILDHPDPFPDNWIYIHSPQVQVGRIQNFRAWSPALVPDDRTASIGMEYFCHAGDGLWSSGDDELLSLATRELDQLGLAPSSSVVDGTVIRQANAYPVYDEGYLDRVNHIRDWLQGLDNLQSVGRGGMHRYNNQDHSMLAAMCAARNILGEDHDAWAVNVERSYHEEFMVARSRKAEPAGP